MFIFDYINDTFKTAAIFGLFGWVVFFGCVGAEIESSLLSGHPLALEETDESLLHPWVLLSSAS